MVLKKTLIIISFMLLSFLSLVSANGNWWTYGNLGGTGTLTSLGNNFVYFGSMFPSNHNTTSPFFCEITTTPLFSPVVSDLNNDGNNEIIIVTSTNRLKIYDSRCGNLFSVGIGEAVTSMPAITNYDGVLGDSFSEITFQGTTQIQSWEYDETTSNYTLKQTIQNIGSGEYGFTCQYYGTLWTCMSINTTGNDWILYELTTGISSVELDFYGGNYKATSPAVFSGFGATRRFVNDDSYDYLITGVHTTSGIRLFSLSVGGENYQCDIEVPSSTYTIFSETHTGAGSLGVATSPNIATSSGILRSGASKIPYYAVCDSSGSRVIYSKLSSGLTSMSNMVITDVDLDNGLDVCVMYYNNTINLSEVLCYDATYDINLRTNLSIRQGYQSLSIADFNPDNDYFEFVTIDGIYQYSVGSDTLISILNTTPYITNESATIQVVSGDTSHSNLAIYTQQNKVLIAGFEVGIQTVCGDGICQSYENLYNCFQDCFQNSTYGKLLTDEACTSDSECLSGKCSYSACTLKGSSENCIADFQCLSGNCLNNKCTKPTYWQTVDSLKKMLFGNDSTTNLFISFLLTFGTAIGVVVTLRSLMAIILAILIIFGGIIFFTVVGWIPAWILIGFIFLSSIFAVVLMILKGGGN